MQQLVTRPRAKRYEMSAPLMYRRAGDEEWTDGRTVNVSRTGVLFTGPPRVLDAAAEVQFVLMLPILGHPGRSRVQCQGRIVRVTRTAADGACAIVATIDGYEFLGIEPEAEPSVSETRPVGMVRKPGGPHRAQASKERDDE